MWQLYREHLRAGLDTQTTWWDKMSRMPKWGRGEGGGGGGGGSGGMVRLSRSTPRGLRRGTGGDQALQIYVYVCVGGGCGVGGGLYLTLEYQ